MKQIYHFPVKWLFFFLSLSACTISPTLTPTPDLLIETSAMPRSTELALHTPTLTPTPVKPPTPTATLSPSPTPDPLLRVIQPKVVQNAVAFSPDGKKLLVGTGVSTAQLWDVRSAVNIQTFVSEASGQIVGVAFNPDGKIAATVGQDKLVRLWDIASGTNLNTLQGGEWAVTFSPSGNWIAAGNNNGVVQIWNAATGESRPPLISENRWAIYSVAFSPDEKYLAAGLSFGHVVLWNWVNGQVIKTLGVLGKWDLRSIAFSPDGAYIAVGVGAGVGANDSVVQLWEVKSSRLIRVFRAHTAPIWSVVFSPDGRWIASGAEDAKVIIWSIEHDAPQAIFSGHTDKVYGVAFSPDGKTVASVSEDKTIRLWRAPDVSQVVTAPDPRANIFLEQPSYVQPIASFGPRGKIYASTYDSTIRTLAVSTADTIYFLDAYSLALRREWAAPSFVHRLQFAPGGGALANEHSVDEIRTPVTYLRPLFENKPNYLLVGGNGEAIFSPNATLCATITFNGTSATNQLRVWRVSDGALLYELQLSAQVIVGLTFTPDGSRLVARTEGPATLQFIDASTGALQAMIETQAKTGNGIVFAPDGQTFAFGEYPATIQIRRASDGELLRKLEGGIGPLGKENTPLSNVVGKARFASRHGMMFNIVEHLIFSQDGKWIAAGINDGRALVWNIETGALQSTLLMNGDVTGLSFGPDNQTLQVIVFDVKKDLSFVQVWNALTGKQIRIVGEGLWKPLLAPQWPLITGLTSAGQLQIWDGDTGRMLTTTEGYTESGTVLDLAFDPSGKATLSGVTLGEVQRWQLSDQSVSTSSLAQPSSAMAFSPHGDWLATWSRATPGIIQLRSLSDNQLTSLGPISHEINLLGLSSDAHILATLEQSSTVQVIDTVQKTIAHSFDLLTGTAHSLALAPNGQFVAIGMANGQIEVWDVVTGQRRHVLNGHTARVVSVAFSPDSRWLASGSEDAKARIWQLDSGEEVFVLEANRLSVTALAFTSDAKVLAAGNADGSIQLWNTVNGQWLTSLFEHSTAVTRVVFSPNNDWLASVATGTPIKLWGIN